MTPFQQACREYWPGESIPSSASDIAYTMKQHAMGVPVSLEIGVLRLGEYHGTVGDLIVAGMREKLSGDQVRLFLCGVAELVESAVPSDGQPLST